MIHNDFLPKTDSVVIAGNPTLGFAQHQVEVSKIETKLETSRTLPDLNFGYFSQTIQGEQQINGVPRIFGKADRFTGIQAGVSIPLWFTSNMAKIKASKWKEKIVQTNASEYAKSLQGNYNSLLGEYAKYSNSLEYYEKQALPEADLIIDQSTKSYKAGAMDYLEYVLSLGRATAIKQNYLETLNNFNQAIVSMDYLMGKIN